MPEPANAARDDDYLPKPGGIAARARAAAAPSYLHISTRNSDLLSRRSMDLCSCSPAPEPEKPACSPRASRTSWPTGRASAGEILAVTFTNKAAREMKARIGAMVGEVVEGMPWLGTFHSIGAKILRRHAELVGLKPDFTILDTDDQIRLLKQLLEAEGIDEKRWPARVLAGLIDSWKNRGLTPEQVSAENPRASRRVKARSFISLIRNA